MIGSTVLVILLSLLLSAFFSGMEIAFVTSNRLHIELENKKGNVIYRILSQLTKQPGRFIAAMLVGNNIALVVYGLFMPELLDPLLGEISNAYLLLFVQTVLSTILILVVAEFVPKAFFSAQADYLLKFFALPATFFYYLFYPLVLLLTWLSRQAIKGLFGLTVSDDQPVFGRVDLDHYIRERTENSDSQEEMDTEIRIFQNALDFSSRKAREFMVPRTEIVAMDVDEPMTELKKEFMESGLSKILIYEESVDHIIGYVHSFELFKKPKDIRSVLRPVSFIPESMAANQILNLLMKEHRSLAVVVDEFGGTSGMITVEDVVEELFGEIDDEHDVEELIERQAGEDEFYFSARLELDYLNEKYRLDLPESENFSTLGGLLVNQLESIPSKGEQVQIGNWLFTVVKVSRNRIEEVRLKRMED